MVHSLSSFKKLSKSNMTSDINSAQWIIYQKYQYFIIEKSEIVKENGWSQFLARRKHIRNAFIQRIADHTNWFVEKIT